MCSRRNINNLRYVDNTTLVAESEEELKSFCTAKETVIKTKKQLTEWEETFAHGISDEGLIGQNV